MVAMQNAPRSEIRMEGLEIEAESVGNERAKFELTIGFGEAGGRLVGGVEYNEELWDEESVRRMMRHLEELLRGVVAGGGKRVRELGMMSAAERQQVLEEWNKRQVKARRYRIEPGEIEAASLSSRADRVSYNPDRSSQTAIAEVWTEVLGLEHVTLEDNFFSLGGHSLLATQAAARLRKWFDIKLPLRKLFDAPTVRQLAEVIDSELSQKLQQKVA
jgi:acyl carrier protein